VSASALALVLVAAVVHASWNRLVHGIEDRVAVLAVAGVVGAVILSPALVLRPPAGGGAAGGGGWPAVVGLVAVGSGTVEAIYGRLLAAAYARGSLAVTYPVGRGTAPLLVTLGGWWLLGQRPAVAAAGGAVLLFVGLVAIAGAARGVGQHGAVAWAAAVGVAIATYSTLDAFAVGRLRLTGTAAGSGLRSAAGPAGYLAVVLGLQGLLLAATVGSRARLRAAARTGAGVGVGVVSAYLLILLAFQRADAGRVATLRETSVLVAVALTPGRRRWTVWAGALCVAAGAVLVAA
jgi:drug/metabolite transporter (DMT)-like permease